MKMSKPNKFDTVRIIDSTSNHADCAGIIVKIVGPFFDVGFEDGTYERFLESEFIVIKSAAQENEDKP